MDIYALWGSPFADHAYAHPCTLEAELRENGTLMNDVKFIGVQNCLNQNDTDIPSWIEFLNPIIDFFQSILI